MRQNGDDFLIQVFVARRQGSRGKLHQDNAPRLRLDMTPVPVIHWRDANPAVGIDNRNLAGLRSGQIIMAVQVIADLAPRLPYQLSGATDRPQQSNGTRFSSLIQTVLAAQGAIGFIIIIH